MRQPRLMFLILLLSVLILHRTQAQQATVYATVVATKLFVVGAANPQTGLFFQRAGDDTTWHHTGSKNIRAFGVAVPVAAEGKVLYIAAGNGVHRSSDGGGTWRITTNWTITEVLWVTADPRDPNRVFCATPYGIFKTTDGCVTWREMNRGLTSLFSPCVIVDHGTPDKVYCVTEDGLFQSTDGAGTWTRMGLSVGNTRVLAQHPKDPAVLIAGTEHHGIYVSRNGGKIWTRSEAGVDHLTFYAIAFDPETPDVVYAGGYMTGVYKSTDGARSWKRFNDGLTHLNVHAIAVDPTNTRRVYAATMWGGVFRSDNGGTTWQHAGLRGSEIWSLVMTPF